MANDTIITVTGNLTAEPELRYTNTGRAVVNFTIASTPRSFDRVTNEWKDGSALFLRTSAWGETAENIAKSLHKGTAVIAQGRLTQRSYQAQDGTNRTIVELTADDIGPSLRRATADVARNSSGSGNFSGNSGSFGNSSSLSGENIFPDVPAGNSGTASNDVNNDASNDANNDPWADQDDSQDPANVPF
ncbi:MAG: single-stranded DNA-binding protein [Candidatus Ancillula sp.]|jgi:single-strand DNA-binding protein|nr:single-stranded DNA-binding protein [Candidatus Ancillula sp.]